MGRMSKGIPVGNVKFIVPDIVEEHVNTAKVIGGNIDFLSEESLPDMLSANKLACL